MHNNPPTFVEDRGQLMLCELLCLAHEERFDQILLVLIDLPSLLYHHRAHIKTFKPTNLLKRVINSTY